MEDAELRAALSQIKPGGRDILRRLLIAEQFERDRYAEALLRSGPTGITLADLLDLASVDPDIRRRLARVLGELEAAP